MSETQDVKPWVKWVALIIVAILGVSVIAGALTSAPAHANPQASLGNQIWGSIS